MNYYYSLWSVQIFRIKTPFTWRDLLTWCFARLYLMLPRRKSIISTHIQHSKHLYSCANTQGNGTEQYNCCQWQARWLEAVTYTHIPHHARYLYTMWVTFLMQRTASPLHLRLRYHLDNPSQSSFTAGGFVSKAASLRRLRQFPDLFW